MRISDWSSDVCSSDLHHEDEVGHRRRIDGTARARPHDQADLRHHAARQHIALEHVGIAAKAGDTLLNARAAAVVEADHRRPNLHRIFHHLADRSEEHTSELQSLMRISYAVFCLKKKTQSNTSQ